MNRMNKVEWVYIILIGTAYMIYGIIQFYNGLAGIFSWKMIQLGILVGNAYIPNTFPDSFSGITLITTGALLLKSSYLREKNYNGYLFVGWSFAILLMVLNLFVLLANILDTYYPLIWGGEVEEGWTLAEDTWGIAPHLLLGVFLLPLYPKMKWMLKELMPSSKK